jgi:chromosome segregation ATPase
MPITSIAAIAAANVCAQPSVLLLSVLRAALIPVALLAASVPALAQADPKSSAEVSGQVQELGKQRAELVARLKSLKGKIDSAGSIVNKKANAADVARETIEELRSVVSPLLAAVADNGEISQLGVAALKNATERRTALERDLRFTPEERQRLVSAWDARIKATAEANAELEKARTKFLALMYTLQTKEDLIGEWAAVAAQDEVINAVRELTAALNETSADVKNFIAFLEGAGA